MVGRVVVTPHMSKLLYKLGAGDEGSRCGRSWLIGAVLVPFLRAAGHQVDGLDLGLYEGCDFGHGPEGIGSRRPRDIRYAEASGWLAMTRLSA